MAFELFANNASTTVSSGGTTAPSSGTTETWTVASSASFPVASAATTATFHVGDPALPGEVIAVTNVAGTTWTVTRGAESTTPVTHTAGFTVRQVVSAGVLGTSTMGLSAYLPSAASWPGIRALPDGSFLVVSYASMGLSGDDGAQINQAFTLLPTYTDPDTSLSYAIGTVRLAPHAYAVSTQITVPPQANLIGAGMGTRLNIAGNIIGVYKHHGVTSGTLQNVTKSGVVSGLHIDGSGSSAGAIGIDVGDGWGHVVRDVWIGNFMLAGSIGFSVCTRQFWTEKGQFKNVSVVNCATAVQIWSNPANTGGGRNSMEYNDMEFYIRVFGAGQGVNTSSVDQRGVIFQGIHWNGSLRVRGNFISPFTLTSSPQPCIIGLYTDNTNNGQANGVVDIHVESNGSGTNPYKWIFGDTSCNFGNFGASGLMQFLGFTEPPSTPAIGQFAFKGPINQSTALRSVQNPGFPATGVLYTNVQNDSIVSITGGTVTQVQVDGVTMPLGSPYYVAWNETIKVTYTGSPSWTWQAAV